MPGATSRRSYRGLGVAARAVTPPGGGSVQVVCITAMAVASANQGGAV